MDMNTPDADTDMHLQSASHVSSSRLVIDGQSGVSLSSDYYEERNIPGKGVGLFAVKFIAAGSRVLCEAPLFVLDEYSDILTVNHTIDGLNEEDQLHFWTLAASTKPHVDDDWVDQLHPSRQDESIESLIEHYEEAMSIYETNRFTIRSPDGENDMTGVFRTAARMNHSCSPNVFHRFNPMIQRLTVHALRAIEPGEEILTAYIDICDTTLARRRVLQHWGFECSCNACSPNDHDCDLRRGRLAELVTQIKILDAERLVGSWSTSQYTKSLGVVEEAVALMEEEGLYESDTLGEIYGKAAQHTTAMGLHRHAQEWALKAAEVERKCCGEDSEEYIKAMAMIHTIAQNVNALL